MQKQPISQTIILTDSITVPQEFQKENIPQIAQYHASETKTTDILHTELHLSFDFKKQYVFGIATLTLSPHFYPQNSIILDAQGFDINSVKLITESKTSILTYKYKSPKLTIFLDKSYKKEEKYLLKISYVAKPNELVSNGSWAILDNRGLYFQNPNTNNPQIWSQGETEANSCWFPTIDAPNQKMTQDIFLTVPRAYKTLSNGQLYNSLLNTDGTRTDHWRQKLPHSPYLTMITVGKFEIIEKQWRNMPVNYYLEPKDVSAGKIAFKNTPEMIEFFSQKFKIDYPWSKYSQVVVRNFISGAMENTSATVFGRFVLRNPKTDDTKYAESVVAHELSHHWFGNLVTCESWSNLPLNESFASYCEYLWFEHKFGKLEADLHLADDYNAYIAQSENHSKNLIRYYYGQDMEMFDVNSYQKGANILHMLRGQVGDDAFFEALHLYLETNKFKSVEIHNLRLAFEEVTGEDLSVFFNQWFLKSGYLKLKVNYLYKDVDNQLVISVNQFQEQNNIPAYQVKTFVDIYIDGKAARKEILLTKREQIFTFKVLKKPDFVNFDAENTLFCALHENKTKEEYIAQLIYAPLFRDKKDAFENLKTYTKDNNVQEAIFTLLNSDFWYYQELAIKELYLKESNKNYKNYKKRLGELSKSSNSVKVRTLASTKLANLK